MERSKQVSGTFFVVCSFSRTFRIREELIILLRSDYFFFLTLKRTSCEDILLFILNDLSEQNMIDDTRIGVNCKHLVKNKTLIAINLYRWI